MGYENITMKANIRDGISYVNYQAEVLLKKKKGSNKQNFYSFLSSVSIRNNSLCDIEDAVLSITSDWPFIGIEDTVISDIQVNKTTDIDSFSVYMNAAELYKLNAPVVITLTFRLFDKNGEVISSFVENVKALPIEEAASDIIGERLDILSSFVTPAADEVENLAKVASSILERDYGRSDFSGYQYHDPNKVKEEAHAAYQALQTLNIRYSEPPASFEKTFQKVRLPHQVVNEKVGTCLDIALLYCSLIENIGLNPLLFIIDGHAYAGVMLDEEFLPHNVEDNVTLLTNAISDGINKILVVNPTDVTTSLVTIPFESSISRAKQYTINGTNLRAVDVHMSHRGETLPIPTPHEIAPGEFSVDMSIFDRSYQDTIEIIDTEHRGVVLSKEELAPKDKFEYWEEKLLDLNLKNKLINFKYQKNGIEFITPDCVKFIEFLASREKAFIECPDVSLSPKENRGPFIFSKVEFNDLANDAYRRGSIIATSENKKSDDYLKSLARKATMTLEESGCNPLFLTIGVVRWFDNDKAAKNNSGSMFAPLFVLPIRMPKRKNTLYYSFEYSIDDLQLNTTLFQYFQHNCGVDLTDISSEHLPLDSRGIPDIRKIFNTIKTRIETRDNWTVVEDVSTISLFSFAHFTMWTDLKTRKETLLENPVVQSLYSGLKSWDDRDDLIDYKELDEKLAPSDLAIPLPADSSQVKAISDSLMGESFILDGPPGTGKSQTIANMIVNFMNHGKSVLFVAEKEVALEVVKRRLDSLGLGDFTLMLSSANASKSRVLAKIGEMLDYGSTKSPEELARTIEEIGAKRNELNEVLAKLHEPNGFFASAYISIINYLSLDNVRGLTTVDEEYAASLTSEKYRDVINELEVLSDKAKINGEYSLSPLIGFTSRNYSLANRDEAIKEIKGLSEELRHYEIDAYNATLKVKGLIPTSRNNLEAFRDIINILRDGRDTYKSVVGSETFRERYSNIVLLLKRYREMFVHFEYISTLYNEGIFTIDPYELKKAWEEAKSLPFLKKIFALPKVKSQLKAFKKCSNAMKNEVIEDVIDRLITIKEIKKESLEANGYDKKVILDTDISTSGEADELLIKLEKSKDLSDKIASINFRDENGKTSSVSYFVSLLSDDSLWENHNFDLLERDLNTLKEKESELISKYSFYLGEYGDFDNYFEKISSKLHAAYTSGGRLGEWVLYLNEIDRARDFVPANVIDDFQEGKIKGTNIIDAFNSALYYRILTCVLDKDNLGALSSRDIDSSIEKYESLISELAILEVKETAARITKEYPTTGIQYAQSSVVANLRKLAKNGGRNTTLRQIFNDEEFASLIRILCPCMLMSPLAVAQYLEPGKYRFDAVIFDEASQIPTSEAIGAIGRGKCCIIAGDEQQMPPTNFFASNITLESEDEAFTSIGEDLESLLDDVIALGLPRRRLTCHYRSRHESLIAFSNKKFYKNSLLTFPSSQNENESVSFRYIEGFYEQKRGRNVQEAEAIVKEVVKRLKDEELSKKSIGIVTFNEAQQNLIDDLLEKEFAKNPSLTNTPGDETIFIKNLENVQGDERDVILFSITYGHDKKTGTFGLNFGPLSREKGERRLNVAVSRAREEMIVFASIQPDEIKAERAKNDGARYLRDFLMFAKSGVDAISNVYDNLSMHNDVSISNFLAKDLQEKGFNVSTNVGASTFKVDLALLNEQGEYVLGVLLDGKSYEESNTCRDRNVVQPSMLKKLGWNLVRVWSVEYFDHKEEVIARIIAAYNAAKTEQNILEAGNERLNGVQFEKVKINATPNMVSYMIYPIGSPINTSDMDNLYIRHEVTQMLKEAIRVEAPVSIKRLEAIFKASTTVIKFNDASKGMFSRCLAATDAVTEDCAGVRFYWPDQETKDNYKFYRANDEMTQRKIQDYSFIELGNLFHDILSLQGKLTIDDLEKETLNALGFKVLNATAIKYLNAALKANNHGRHNIEIGDDDHVYLF